MNRSTCLLASLVSRESDKGVTWKAKLGGRAAF